MTGYPEVDLALVDIVLAGGKGGPALVEDAQCLRPDLKIIYMSGYSADAARKGRFPTNGDYLLKKPFRRRELAHTLHHALEGDHSSFMDWRESGQG